MIPPHKLKTSNVGRASAGPGGLKDALRLAYGHAHVKSADEIDLRCGAAVAGAGRPDPPAHRQPPARGRDLRLLLRGASWRAAAEDLAPSCVPPARGRRRR